MHPILARGGRLALYAAAWALAGALLAALVSSAAGVGTSMGLAIALPLAITYGFFCLSSWYVARSMPLAATGALRIAVTALSAAAVSGGIWLALARAWLAVLASAGAGFAPPEVHAATAPLIFGFGVLLYLLTLAIGYMIAAFEQSRDAERRGLETQVLAREAELRVLRAQIDPHFLFNSLHSISALTASDPAAARRMCVLLADFLRDSLSLGAEARIPLARELSIASRFLDIERVRFGDRLRVAIEPGGADDCLVPPLILQPLVENAVTHGIAHVLEGGTITIHASATPATLTLLVENPCDPDRPRSGGAGVGLSNVRARLRTLHGDDARVSAGESAGRWRVELAMPAIRA